jgi:ATP-dependent Zn protease
VNTVVNQGSMLGSLLIYMLPLLLLVGLFMMFSRMQTGGRMGFGFGKSKAKQLSKDMPKTTFADVAGADEAVEELYEIKDFLQNPARYQALGAKIPRACCSTVRREPARRCWPAPWPARPACRSSPSPVRTSSRCSSASVRPGA